PAIGVLAGLLGGLLGGELLIAAVAGDRRQVGQVDDDRVVLAVVVAVGAEYLEALGGLGNHRRVSGSGLGPFARHWKYTLRIPNVKSDSRNSEKYFLAGRGGVQVL